MGICTSIESVSVSPAKLILQDGQLLEFSYPVRVSYVLQKNLNCFICDSDEMEFDDIVTAIDEDDDLQPGKLYFALPITKLRKPLQTEEMAALAVKASAALMKNGDGLKGLSTITTARKPRREKMASSDCSVRRFGNKTGGNRRTSTKMSTGCRGRKFVSKLGAIAE